MSAQQRPAKKKKAPQSKCPTEIISANPTRRSRAERALVQMTTTSYPHYFVGNIGLAIFGKDDAALKPLLDAENQFLIVDFVRELTLDVSGDVVTFGIGSVRIDANTSRTDNQLGGELNRVAFTSTKAESKANLAENEQLVAKLVEIYHRNQVRGMTRNHAIDADNWAMVEKKITVGSTGGFGGLGRSETKFDVKYSDVLGLIQASMKEESYKITFGSSAITIVTSADEEATKEIVYSVPGGI